MDKEVGREEAVYGGANHRFPEGGGRGGGGEGALPPARAGLGVGTWCQVLHYDIPLSVMRIPLKMTGDSDRTCARPGVTH